MSYQHQVLGTVISSVLNYDQLCKEMGENPAIDNTKSSYAPCDGRPISGSQLDHKTAGAMKNAPDLRGKFMRGLNVIYSVGQPTPFDPKLFGDPQDNRKVNDYQPDVLLAHSHPASGHINGSVCGSNGSHDVDEGDQKWNSDPNFGDHNVVVTVGDNANGGLETRPRNIAVYFYIKIN